MSRIRRTVLALSLLASSVGLADDDFPEFKVPHHFQSKPGLIFTATGEWFSSEIPKGQLPLGALSLKCFKAQKYCTQGSAYVYKGILSVDATVFDIRSWTETQIVLEPIKATCDTSTIVVDLVNEKVLMRVQVKRDTKFCADTSKGAPAKYSMELRGNI